MPASSALWLRPHPDTSAANTSPHAAAVFRQPPVGRRTAALNASPALARRPRARSCPEPQHAWRRSPTEDSPAGHESSRTPAARIQTPPWPPAARRTRSTGATSIPGREAASCAIISGLCAPPPDTINSSMFVRGRMNRRKASAMDRGVKIVAVRTRSAGPAWCCLPQRQQSLRVTPARTVPAPPFSAVFFAGRARASSAPAIPESCVRSMRSSRRGRTPPGRAWSVRPARPRSCSPVRCRTRTHSRGRAPAGITVTLAIPPIFSATRPRRRVRYSKIVREGNQRRALASRRHIRRTKISYRGNSRALGDHADIPNLQRGRPPHLALKLAPPCPGEKRSARASRSARRPSAAPAISCMPRWPHARSSSPSRKFSSLISAVVVAAPLASRRIRSRR